MIADLRAGFTIPGSHNPFYNGQYLADAEDVVVVTFKSVVAYQTDLF